MLAVRHNEKLEGKLPEKIVAKKVVPFTDLIDDAVRYAKAQNDAFCAHDLELKLERVRPTSAREPLLRSRSPRS